MKKILITIPVFCLIVLSGCLKDKPNVDFSNLGYIAEISTASNNPTLNAPSSGYANFPAATLFFASAPNPYTVMFTVNIASDYPPTKDVPVTVGVDQAALAKYNADTVTNSSRIQYEIFPDSTFSFPVTSGTIKAGQRLDTFYVTFNTSMIDPTHSYMLPISIVTATGTTISGNLSTIYFHAIGNPLAGNYVWDFTRYSAPSNAGSPDGNSFTGGTAVFIPDNPTTVEVGSGYYIHPRYVISFKNTNGVLSNFSVVLNPADVASMTAGGVTVTDGPNIIKADPINKIFTFQYKTVTRYVIDSYHE